MSHVDSKDDEVKSILAEINSNDSKESKPSKSKPVYEPKYKKDSEGVEWEVNEIEDDDANW